MIEELKALMYSPDNFKVTLTRDEVEELLREIDKLIYETKNKKL